MVYSTKIHHISSQNRWLAELMENMNTLSTSISNKQIPSIGDDSRMRVATLKKTSCYLSDILSIKSEKFQSSVSPIANDQTVKLVNSETNGKPQLPLTRSFTANVI